MYNVRSDKKHRTGGIVSEGDLHTPAWTVWTHLTGRDSLIMSNYDSLSLIYIREFQNSHSAADPGGIINVII